MGSLLALALALLNRLFRLGLLSRLAEQVTFVLIPPLVLIFLVLGTIFLGVATPTEGGAMGAVGALIMALAKRRLSFSLLNQALDSTVRLSCFVLFILIGSTVFSFTFNAADGHIWVEHLFDKLPGGAMGFMIVVNILVFILGMFIDFFEIAFIVVPMLAPVAAKVLPELLPEGAPPEMALIWFGIILAMNLQTSFLTPPFGFALFYLRSVAARNDYTDQVTKQRIPAVTTAQIYNALGGPDYIRAFNDNGLTRYLLRVDPYIQHNAWIGYRFARNRSWLEGASVRLGMNNVFDEDPPMSSDQYGYRTGGANPRGRQFTMEVSKKF